MASSPSMNPTHSLIPLSSPPPPPPPVPSRPSSRTITCSVRIERSVRQHHELCGVPSNRRMSETGESFVQRVLTDTLLLPQSSDVRVEKKIPSKVIVAVRIAERGMTLFPRLCNS